MRAIRWKRPNGAAAGIERCQGGGEPAGLVGAAAGIPGGPLAVLAMLSFSYGLFIIFKHLLYGDAVRGWATLITVVLFFAGVNMLSLGVVGEYVASIFAEVKHRPLYLVHRRRGQGLASGQPPAPSQGQDSAQSQTQQQD